MAAAFSKQSFAAQYALCLKKDIELSESITLRSATIQDADLLFEWRNDPETRKASHNTAEVQRPEHVAWLSTTLKNPNRRIFVVEEDGSPVGTVRADLSEGVWELSWTVNPNARGRGVAKRMVALLSRQIAEPIRAEVKAGNIASARIAEHAGMEFDREADGVLHYRRAAVKCAGDRCQIWHDANEQRIRPDLTDG